MSNNVHPSVDEQFRDIQGRVIARMIKDGELLMYLSKEWYNNPPDCSDSGCFNFISEGYAINIKKL